MVHQDSIKSIIQKNGPSGASKVKSYLIAQGINEEAARQRISRSLRKGEIEKFKKLQLPKKENFLFLNDHRGEPEFWESLIKAHVEANSTYGIAMKSIMSRGGAIPKRYFDILSGAPEKLKKHLHPEKVLENLIFSGLLRTEEDDELGESIFLDAEGTLRHIGRDALRVKVMVEDILINAVYDWSRKMGFASYNAIKKKSLKSIPKWGHFGWDITAPCGVLPIARFNDDKFVSGFVVIDVTTSSIDINGLKYFLNKCSTIRSIQGMRPFLAMFVADGFSEKAFKLGKQKGIVLTTPEILFGKDIAESIRSLTSTLENAAAIAVKSPDKIFKLFNSLSNIEGAATNLRGALFELIVGHLVYKGEGTTIDIGVKVENDIGKRAEIDVRRVKGEHQVALYECKGYQPSTQVTLEEIETWLNKKVPIIRTALINEKRFQNADMIFEFWTTGDFTPDAVAFLESRQKSTKKYQIQWKNGSEVMKYARSIRSTSMIDTLKQHYLKHPLAE